MKRTTALLALLLILVGVFFLTQKEDKPLDFKVEKPEEISKIEMVKVIKGETRKTIILEKKSDDNWVVDGKFGAVPKKVQNLLKVVSQLYIKKPIRDKAQESALSILKKNHTLVKIYKGDDLAKEYYVGATDQKQTANIMMLTGSEEAALVSLPGFEGYVSIYYATESKEWREKLLFDLKAEEMRKISVKYQNYEGSFLITRDNSESPWKLDSGKPVNQEQTKAYMDLFRGKVFAVNFAEKEDPEIRTTLENKSPDVTLSWETIKDQQGELYLFVRPENPNNYFGYVKGNPETYIIQHPVIDAYLKTVEYFEEPVL